MAAPESRPTTRAAPRPGPQDGPGAQGHERVDGGAVDDLHEAQGIDLRGDGPGSVASGELRQERQEQQRPGVQPADGEAAPERGGPRFLRRVFARGGDRRAREDAGAEPQEVGGAREGQRGKEGRLARHDGADARRRQGDRAP